MGFAVKDLCLAKPLVRLVQASRIEPDLALAGMPAVVVNGDEDRLALLDEHGLSELRVVLDTVDGVQVVAVLGAAVLDLTLGQIDLDLLSGLDPDLGRVLVGVIGREDLDLERARRRRGHLDTRELTVDEVVQVAAAAARDTGEHGSDEQERDETRHLTFSEIR
jgi:hypothetical protein